MATITFFSNMRAFASALGSKSDQIRDSIENVGEDVSVQTVDNRPALVEKMMGQLSNIEDQGAKLTKKTIESKRSVSASRIADVAARLQARCSSEMVAVEAFLKQYGYKRNFSKLQEKLASNSADSDADLESPSASSQDNKPSSAQPATSKAVATNATETTVVYNSPSRVEKALDEEEEDMEEADEGDISTVQKEPRPTDATPSASSMGDDTNEVDDVVVNAIDFSCTEEDQDATIISAMVSTPGPADPATFSNTAVEDAPATTGAMTIGFKDEPEPVGTPSFDDCGFSAMTMAMIHQQRPAGSPKAIKTLYRSGSARKDSLGAQSEGSPAPPEMKSIKFSRTTAMLDHTPDLKMSQKIEDYTQLSQEGAVDDAAEETTTKEAVDEDRTEEVNPAANLNFSIALEDLVSSPGGTPAPDRAASPRAASTNGTPQFSHASGTPSAPAIDLSHMLEFAPKSAANNQADQRPQEEEVSSNASIKFVVAEDLSKAPSYLRAQFDCDTLNEMLKEVNVFLAETATSSGSDVSDLIITEDQIRERLSLPSSKAKAMVLLLVKMKRLRIVAKDRYTLPK